MSYWDVFWHLVWLFFWGFVIVAYLFTLVTIVVDLFRDRELNGWWKALWLLFLVFVPILTALAYVIARGRGMAERETIRRDGPPQENNDYRPQPSASPADDIATAKRLLDSGAISQGEYDALKSKALGRQYFG